MNVMGRLRLSRERSQTLCSGSDLWDHLETSGVVPHKPAKKTSHGKTARTKYPKEKALLLETWVNVDLWLLHMYATVFCKQIDRRAGFLTRSALSKYGIVCQPESLGKAGMV